MKTNFGTKFWLKNLVRVKIGFRPKSAHQILVPKDLVENLYKIWICPGSREKEEYINYFIADFNEKVEDFLFKKKYF